MESIIEIPTDKEFNAHHEKCFNELPKDILHKAIQIFNDDTNFNERKFLINLYNIAPIDTKALWFIPYHSYEGMVIRNKFRRSGLLDEMLPSGNWDDYYVQVMECAIGVREYE